VSELNPLAGAILQSTVVQREAGIEKERQVRRAQILEKDVAAADDRFEHQVESADEVPEANDEEKQKQPKGRQDRKREAPDGGEEPHIDLKG
jgi:hypothetical protein